MKRGAAIAVAMAALFAAGEAAACEPVGADMIFRSRPNAVAAEVANVRLAWPHSWEWLDAPVYVAELKPIGPTLPMNLPNYRWAANEHCDPRMPVKQGQQVWVLLEAAELTDDRSIMVIQPYTDDLSEVRKLLETYTPFQLIERPIPPPPSGQFDRSREVTR